MKALLIITLLALGGSVREPMKRIGSIEFFGYSGIDLEKLKAALPIREGQEFKVEQPGDLARITMRTKEAVQRVLKRPPTDFAPVCCDTQGNWMVYIGLSGKAARYRPGPKGEARLPAELTDLYKRFMSSLQEAIRKGAFAEDRSAGYALSTDPALRKTQLEMRETALKQEDLLRDVLETSSDAQHRTAAAEILGYAEQSPRQISALASAASDPDGTVRNNATRALGVLVQSNPKLGQDIPSSLFVDLLLSGRWTDLNKAGMLLAVMTADRTNESALVLLRRADVRERLIEMSRWKTGHASDARYLLGRSTGIPEERLKELVSGGEAEEIIRNLER